MDEKTIARFWAKVDKSAGPDGCWLWTAHRSRAGYGSFRIGGRAGNMLKAHRVAWELANGPIPSAGDHHGTMCVCHKCDVTGCVNPAHLFLGSQTENTRDMDAKGRRARGESNGSAKLVEAEVRDILGLRASSREIARRYGVSRRAIRDILAGKTWAHVGGRK